MRLCVCPCMAASCLPLPHALPTACCRYDPATGLLHPTPNMNLVNLVLRVAGPCTELWLCLRILFLQVICCGTAFAARKLLAGIYK